MSLVRASLALLVVLLVVGAASAQGRHPRRVLREALAEFDRGHFEESRALFLEAYDLRPSARLLRGAGMASFEMREYVAAIDLLRRALDETAGRLSRRQRRQVEELLVRAESFVGRYRLIVEPPGAEVRIDTAPAQPTEAGIVLLDLGEHSITASAEGFEDLERRLDVHGGEDDDLRLQLEPIVAPESERLAATERTMPERSYDRGLALGMVVAGSAFAAAAVGTGVWWRDRRVELGRCEGARQEPGQRCLNRDALAQNARGAAVSTVILGVAGLTGLLVGILRLRWSGTESEESALRCGASPSSVACALRF